MKEEEVRKGNWVYGTLNDPMEIPSAKHISEFVNTYSPIPLTEEWLLRFGFEKESDFKFVNKIANRDEFQIVAITKDGKNDWGIIIRTFDSPVHLSIYEHVHQLQNLFHAITGIELKLKQ